MQNADRTLQIKRWVVWGCLAVGAGCGGPPPERGGAADVPPPPPAWEPLVGEYARDGVVLLLLERGDTLRIVTDSAPEVAVAAGRGDTLAGVSDPARLWVVVRDTTSAVAGLRDASGVWERRDPGEPVFRIVPRRPVSELRREARTAVPPTEASDLLPPDLVDVHALDSTIRLDVRYASADNFLGEPVYASARAYLQRPAAEALVRAHRGLAAAGYGLLIHDAYRPWHISWVFWEATADSLRRFVADPAQGSRHNRGAAVDLTLYDRATGQPVTMPSGYDEFSVRAHPGYPGGTSRQRWLRDLLRGAMEAQGFRVYEYEWWHFDFGGWERYPILNLALEELGRM
jgi:serine beta-lactamase-like protein LACTB